MRVFARLRAQRAFEKRHLPFLQTIVDFDLVVEIGYHAARGKPLALKQLYHLGIGAVATIERRLARLKRLGVVEHRRSIEDARHRELTLSEKLRRAFAQYDALLHWNGRVR